MNEVSFRSRLARYSLQGWFRFIRLKLLRRSLVVEGSCLLCGRCCRRVSLEAKGRWLRKKAEYLHLISEFPEYSRFELVDCDRQGFLLFSCQWFDDKKGICSDHENRLTLCRSYPDPELYFTGGSLHEGCGYRFREIARFALILEREIEKTNQDKKCEF